MPGKEASFVVLDQDLMRVSPSRIRHIQVLETWQRGRLVYRREASAER